MILDELAQADLYLPLHPGFKPAFELLRSLDEAILSENRIELDGNRLFAIVNRGLAKGRDRCTLECHRKYIDIQYTISGDEEIGYRPVRTSRFPATEYDDSRDILFFNDQPETWLPVPPGSFTIFYPQDVHAPMAGKGELLKVVVKVAVKW